MPTWNEDKPEQAILIIHGIGQQQRFETLDRFADGLRRVLNCDKVYPLELPESSSFNYCVRLQKSTFSPDVFEFYWAPYTSGKTSIAAMVGWILQAGSTPIRNLADNLGLVSLQARPPAGKFRLILFFLRELWRVVYVLALSIALAAGTVTLLGKTADFWNSLSNLYDGIRSYLFGDLQDIVTVAIFAIAFIVLVALLWSLRRQSRHVSQEFKRWREAMSDAEEKLANLGASLVAGSGWSKALFRMIHRVTQQVRLKQLVDSFRREFVVRVLNLVASAVLIVGLLVLVWVLVFGNAEHLYLSTAVRDAGIALWAAEAWQSALLVVGLLVMAFVVKRVMLDFLADIALYTTLDERSTFAETRRDILKDAAERLKWLLGPEGYQRVALAGHSLGSVIAYDVINELITADRTARREKKARKKARKKAKGPGFRLDRLGTFITFGSPLNKILYFFRPRVDSQQTIRTLILRQRYGFRRPRRPLRTDITGPYEKDHSTTDQAQLPNLHWVNVYAPLDPISAKLIFYYTDDEVRRWYLRPGLSHMSYWDDQVRIPGQADRHSGTMPITIPG